MGKLDRFGGQRTHKSNTTATIQLPLTAARVLTSNNIPAIAAVGGLLASDSLPSLQHVNGATDKSLVINWAATSVTEIQWQITSPEDFDPSAPVYVNVIAYMGGATDTPTLTVAFFEGFGGTNLGGATAALSTTKAKKFVSVAATATTPAQWAISVVPGTHGTDAVKIIGAWVSYTKM